MQGRDSLPRLHERVIAILPRCYFYPTSARFAFRPSNVVGGKEPLSEAALRGKVERSGRTNRGSDAERTPKRCAKEELNSPSSCLSLLLSFVFFFLLVSFIGISLRGRPVPLREQIPKIHRRKIRAVAYTYTSAHIVPGDKTEICFRYIYFYTHLSSTSSSSLRNFFWRRNVDDYNDFVHSILIYLSSFISFFFLDVCCKYFSVRSSHFGRKSQRSICEKSKLMLHVTKSESSAPIYLFLCMYILPSFLSCVTFSRCSSL